MTTNNPNNPGTQTIEEFHLRLLEASTRIQADYGPICGHSADRAVQDALEAELTRLDLVKLTAQAACISPEKSATRVSAAPQAVAAELKSEPDTTTPFFVGLCLGGGGVFLAVVIIALLTRLFV